MSQLRTLVKTKKKKRKERRKLIVKEIFCPYMSQIHNLMRAVLNEETRSNAGFTLTGDSSDTTPKKILFIVIPYLSHQTLIENCNKITTPFLALHQDSIRSSKSIIVKEDTPACFILNSVLLADQSTMSIPAFSTTKTENGTTDLYTTNQHGLKKLLLSTEEFSSFAYPIEYKNWKKKQKAQLNRPNLPKLKSITVKRFTSQQCEVLEKDPDFEHLIAIDCEMCLTKKGSELVRISVVTPYVVHNTSTESTTNQKKKGLQMKFQVILDTFVKPSTPVLDYLSKYSGVYEDDLTGKEKIHFLEIAMTTVCF
jgi:hypothetical protein